MRDGQKFIRKFHRGADILLHFLDGGGTASRFDAVDGRNKYSTKGGKSLLVGICSPHGGRRSKISRAAKYRDSPNSPIFVTSSGKKEPFQSLAF